MEKESCVKAYNILGDIEVLDTSIATLGSHNVFYSLKTIPDGEQLVADFINIIKTKLEEQKAILQKQFDAL